MNRFAYRTTSLVLKALSGFSKAKIFLHGQDCLPEGPIIFVVNHFTRVETLFLPYHIYHLTKLPVWSLADYTLFEGTLGKFLDMVGAVSTKDPDRDLLIVKSLLTGEATWIIFPEGRMVKSKKIIEKGRFMISHAGGKHPPHTGAATLALRTEFYRKRLRTIYTEAPDEAKRLMGFFQIETVDAVSEKSTQIVPVNITYYPIRAHENIASNLLQRLVEGIPERYLEEVMAEGTMMLSGVDVDIRFGESIDIGQFMVDPAIERDFSSPRRIDFDDPIPSKKIMRKTALKIMQRYMSDIYSMTTVNHEHLFASILRLIPFRRINEYDLRQRVFLAATRNLERMEVHPHWDLKQDQVHLLTDDRFDKVKDFISLALEKGIVKKEGDTLIKDPSKFSRVFDFHRVRIDNPIEVVANEVEPLRQLQKHVRRLAWQPGFWIRHKIVNHLVHSAVSEFEEDYRNFRTEGESKPKEVGMPFLIKGRCRNTGVVLLHGYMAAPLEVKELAEHLGRRGLWVYVPRLRGHGTSPDDLAKRSYMEWVESCDRGYAIVNNICKRVVVGGFSTGAGLALDLAARVKAIKGVFAICPPLRLQDLSSRFVPAVNVWNRWMDIISIRSAKKEFVENRPENPHINYFRNPIHGVTQLGMLMEALEPELPGIQAPALVVQSDKDPVVDPRGSREVFERLGSKDKRYLLFNFDRHGILLGDDAQRVHRAIGDFVGCLE
jgi:esterase/lipase/1-acyl-sn-glycerol-3-phosphate acyltransferase